MTRTETTRNRARSLSARGAVWSAAAVVVSASVFAPSSVHAAPLPAEGTADATCAIVGGTLEWGVKESFRSYISGSIAKGEWTTSGGAAYATPRFSWSNATGAHNPETGVTTASFLGEIVFTGHDGILNLSFANPTVVIQQDGSAQLLVDAKSNDLEGNLAVDEHQVVIADVGPLGTAAPAESASFADAPVTLTESGQQAFASFYEAGEALDPLNLAIDVAPCTSAAPEAPGAGDTPEDADTETVPSTSTPEVTQTPETAENSGLPWLPIGLGAGALVIIGIAVTLLLKGRKRQDSAAQTTPDAAGNSESDDSARGADQTGR